MKELVAHGFAALVALVTLVSPAAAQEPRGRADQSLAPIVEKVAPSVVSIYAFGNDAMLVGSLKELGLSRVQQREKDFSFGSGAIVDSAGWIITCAHVVEGAADVKVVLPDTRELRAETVLVDRRSDIAVLRVKTTEPLPALRLANSDKARVGDFAIVFGNPYAVGQTITYGVVSAVDRSQPQTSGNQLFIQTDAAINPGNSGGPMVNLDGEVIGVATGILSQTGGSQGLGFAIPANMASFVLSVAREGRKLARRPWLGATIVALEPAAAARLGLQGKQGALVKSVVTGGPAAEAGLNAGDFIVSVNGHAVHDTGALEYHFSLSGLTGQARLGALRNGADITLPVALSAAPETRPRNLTRIKAFSPLQGATVANLSPALAEEVGLDTNATGVTLVDIELDTPAKRFGFQRGDILVRANGSVIKNAPDIERLLQKEQLTQIEIERSGRRMSVQIDSRKSRR